MERYLRTYCQEELGINGINGLPPYFFIIRLSKGGVKEFTQEIAGINRRDVTEDDLVGMEEAPQLQKYDEFIPASLLQKAFAADYLDVAELQQVVKGWQQP